MGICIEDRCMDIVEQKKAAEQFVNDWIGRGDKKQDTQNYWNQLLRTVYGVSVPEQYIAYEKPVAKQSVKNSSAIYGKLNLTGNE